MSLIVLMKQDAWIDHVTDFWVNWIDPTKSNDTIFILKFWHTSKISLHPNEISTF